MHFNNHVFFKNEKNHIKLKTKFHNFIVNFKIVVINVDRIYDRQREKYCNDFNYIKQRLNHNFKKSLYRDFIVYITFFALKKINKHYKRLLKTQKKNVHLFSCIHIFKRTINLFCSHVIEKRLIDTTNEKILKLKNVHYH